MLRSCSDIHGRTVSRPTASHTSNVSGSAQGEEEALPGHHQQPSALRHSDSRCAQGDANRAWAHVCNAYASIASRRTWQQDGRTGKAETAVDSGIEGKTRNWSD